MTLRQSLLILILATTFAYLPSLNNPFIWDDEQFIVKNVYITSLKYLPQIFTTNTIAGAGHQSNYYRPFTTLSFALDYSLWQTNPIGFHLTNTLLHLMAGIILFLLLLRLSLPQTLAFWTSLFFLIHPIQTEAIVYINSRGDPLYALFLFGAIYFYTFPNWRRLSLSLLLFALSILSKEISVAGLGLFFLLWWLYQRKSRQHLITFLIATTIVILYLILRFTILNFGQPPNPYGTLTTRLLTFSHSFLVYLRLLLIPWGLHMERDLPLITTIFSVYPWLSLGIVTITIWLGRHHRWLLFGLIWFLVMLVPVSGIIPVNALLYEHWLYLPMVGFFIALLTSLPRLPTYLLITITAIYIALTWRQNYLWGNPIRFYQYTLQYTKSPRLLNNLAMAYADANRLPEAITYYQKAINLSDVYPQTHHNLGNAYAALGQSALAEQEYLTALKLDPNFYFTYQSLVNLYLQTHQPDKAQPYLEKLNNFSQ